MSGNKRPPSPLTTQDYSHKKILGQDGRMIRLLTEHQPNAATSQRTPGEGDSSMFTFGSDEGIAVFLSAGND